MSARWRDVPMPPAVAALPRDKRGFPVPWVSEWTGETKLGVIQALHLGIVQVPYASCTCTIGVGEPDLGTLCMKRQMTGMVERLCDVCGEFIPPGPIYFLGGDIATNGQKVSAGDTGYRECGLHHACALYSAQVCPGITTKGDAVRVVECTAYLPQPEFIVNRDGEAVRMIFTSFQDPELTAIASQTRAILTGVFALPIDPVIVPVTQWLEAQTERRSA